MPGNADDIGDIIDGHGTHMAGTIAGELVESDWSVKCSSSDTIESTITNTISFAKAYG